MLIFYPVRLTWSVVSRSFKMLDHIKDCWVMPKTVKLVATALRIGAPHSGLVLAGKMTQRFQGSAPLQSISQMRFQSRAALLSLTTARFCFVDPKAEHVSLGLSGQCSLVEVKDIKCLLDHWRNSAKVQPLPNQRRL